MKSIVAKFLIVAGLLAVAPASARSPEPPARTYPVTATTRDGHTDFDFEFGNWRTHYRLLENPLTGSHTWYDCYGTSAIRPFWNGYGNLEDGDLKCPSRSIGGMTLRTYDARTHQWSLWWGTRKLGVSPPAQVGHFASNGTGDFYAYDTWKGKPIIVRFEWTLVRGNPHFEQAFSTDGAKSWEVNWTTQYVRAPSTAKGVWNTVDTASDGHDAFDFLRGRWTLHTRRLAHDDTWSDCYGTAIVRSFWGGAGDIQDADIRCASQRIHALSFRLFDAATRRWKLYRATQNDGLDPDPEIGRFAADGTGNFFATGTLRGKPIVTRDHWTHVNGNPRYERAYSGDGGKSWEVNWTTDYTRT